MTKMRRTHKALAVLLVALAMLSAALLGLPMQAQAAGTSAGGVQMYFDYGGNRYYNNQIIPLNLGDSFSYLGPGLENTNNVDTNLTFYFDYHDPNGQVHRNYGNGIPPGDMVMSPLEVWNSFAAAATVTPVIEIDILWSIHLTVGNETAELLFIVRVSSPRISAEEPADDPAETFWRDVAGQLAALGGSGSLTADAAGQTFVPYYILQQLHHTPGQTLHIKTGQGTLALNKARLAAAGIDVDKSHTLEALIAAGQHSAAKRHRSDVYRAALLAGRLFIFPARTMPPAALLRGCLHGPQTRGPPAFFTCNTGPDMQLYW